MIRRRFPLLRSTIGILVVLSFAFVLVHWHVERAGQDCGLCYAHQMPGLEGAGHSLLADPEDSEHLLTAAGQVLVSSAFIPAHPGRAPPDALSTIFG